MHIVLRSSCLPSLSAFSPRWQLSIQCYWDQYTEMFYVTIEGLMARAATSVLVLLDFTAAWPGWSTRYYCDDVVGAASPGIWTRILSGIILVAFHALLLLMCLVGGISHYPKLLQCWLRPGVFPWIYMWLPQCGGTEGVYTIRWFSRAVVSTGSWQISMLTALLRYPPPEKLLSNRFFFSFKQARNNTRGKTYNKRKATSLVFWETFLWKDLTFVFARRYLKTLTIDKQAGVGNWVISRLFGDALTLGVTAPLIKNILEEILPGSFMHR